MQQAAEQLAARMVPFELFGNQGNEVNVRKVKSQLKRCQMIILFVFLSSFQCVQSSLGCFAGL